MGITSVCLSPLPFIANTDATRLQMASKQIQQTLTSLNCDIPYILSTQYTELLESSAGIMLAKDDGFVVWSGYNVIVVYYRNLQDLVVRYIPRIKKCYSKYGSFLRHCLKTGMQFKQGDVIFEYDCFYYGVPSVGYNTTVGYFVFAGFNHEDPIVISESFADRATVTYIDKVFIPIYEQSIFKPIYPDGRLFPNLKERINSTIVAHGGLLKDDNSDVNLILRNAHINLLTAFDSNQLPQYNSKIDNGYVVGIKVHKLMKDPPALLQKQLQVEIEQLLNQYGNQINNVYKTLNKDFGEYTNVILRKYFLANKRRTKFDEFDLSDAIYLLEFDIADICSTKVGDKFANRYAGKGTVSLILPDELRPVGLYSKKPIDYIINTFSVPSRMNWGQILETQISKAVQCVDEQIKANPTQLTQYLKTLLPVVEQLHSKDSDYLKQFYELLVQVEQSNIYRQNLLQRINKTNIFIEAQPFIQLDIRKLNNYITQNFLPLQEPVVLTKKLFNYLKDKLGSKSVMDITMNSDSIHINAAIGPQYILKLSKIAADIAWARDFGPIKITTGQPLRGKAKKGGVRLGNMEIDGILAHGCEKALREFLTVKSDNKKLKQEMIFQILKSGEFNLFNTESQSTTKNVIDIVIDFLND